ncbi:MAG: hypothetical protein BGO21_02825 [Dyadobacter sp. 50-39]|uniref:hypothetical protein n=1 Tax=Dyadobacter sp. 50-39 TaxID=1895756 RepID=UPI000958F9DD|nr:hypothetical protein [Dyadobacter sp. 50-39]OJV12694.1 MAG: hypothetical protein BGO21_02825 [Dyadobacter sp. 50-39]
MLSKTIMMAALAAGSFCADVQAGTPSLSRIGAAKVVPDSIDLTKIPYSEKELAAFPTFNPPTDIVPLNKPLIRDFDRLFFPTKQGMIALEGKVYKAFVTSVTGKEWSLPYFEKSYRDLITAAGGVLIYQGKVAPAELERIKDEATYFGEEGSIDYTNTVVKVYAIRRKEGDHVFVQFSGYSAGGSIQILQLPKKEK